MTDELDPLDALKTAVNVAPSPEFLAKVRMRIANEPAPRSWNLSWLVGLGSAVAVAATLLIAFQLRREPPQPAVAQASRPAPNVAQPSMPAPDVAQPFRAAPSVAQPQRVALRSLPEPEILIDPREAAALRWLIDGRSPSQARVVRVVDAGPIVTQADLSADLEITPLPASAPLTIPLLDGSEGARQ
jgi:hypothetical protein